MLADTEGKPTQCPGCGYQPSSPEDPFYTAYDGKVECPRGGIIPSKVKPVSAPEPHGIASNTSMSSSANFGLDSPPQQGKSLIRR